MRKHDLPSAAATADADLILRTRSGDRGAFAELWRRHYPAGMSVARSITSSIEPADLVQESYTRIYQAILKGGGPNGSFRAYLFTSIRNTAAAWGRSRREVPLDDLDTIADPHSTEDAANEALDRDLTAQAFRSIPSRWQEVLWYTEVEQMKPAEVALLLGMKAGAVSQLAFRAREGLREAWIQAHLRSAKAGSECRWTIDHLGAHSRGNLGARDRKRLDQHLDDCERCILVATEAKEVSSRLALVLLPLVLGVTGASGYVAALHASTPAIAVAAMPSAVFEGGIVVKGSVAGVSATGVPVDGGSSGGFAGGAATGSSGSGITGGAITGIGALVGTGSAALVVAGVVAAATIVPGLINASPDTSLPSAGDVNNSSISSEVEPDPDVRAEDKFVLEIDEETPEPPVQEDHTQELKRQIRDDATEAERTQSPVSSVVPGDGNGGDGDEGTVDPGDGDDGGNQGGDDGEGDEGEGDDGSPIGPALPNAPVDVVNANLCMNDAFETVVSVELSGLQGVDLQPFIGGATGGTHLTTFDANGSATATLKPTLRQILTNSAVEFRYTTAGTEFPRSTSLKALGVTVLTAAAAPACEPSGENVAEPTPTESADATLEQQPVEVAAPSAERPPAEQPLEQSVLAPPSAPAQVPADASLPAKTEVVLEEELVEDTTVPDEEPASTEGTTSAE